MSTLNLPPLPPRAEEKFLQRQSNFYSQSIEQNNTRLNGKQMDNNVREELKFIQADLLARFGEEI